MKYIIRCLWLFSIFMLLSRCEQPPQIGILFDTNNSERWLHDKEKLIEQITQRGALVLYYDSDGSHESQVQYFKSLVDQDIQLLILVAADLNKAAEIVEEARRQDIKVIAYDRLIKNCEPDFYISFDNIEVGKMQARYMTAVCPSGNYALIGGAPSDNNSYLLRTGQMNILQPLINKGDIRIVYDQFVDQWSEAEGYRHMEQSLQAGHIDAVIAANDQLANGVIKSLKAHNLAKQVYVSGQDATLKGCRNILMDYQTMTVYKPIGRLADSTIAIAFKMLGGNLETNRYSMMYNGKNLIPSLLLTPVAVHKNNLDSTVLQSGFIDRQKLYDNISSKDNNGEVSKKAAVLPAHHGNSDKNFIFSAKQPYVWRNSTIF